VGGDEVTRFQEGGKQYDVRVRLLETDRNDPVKVETLSLRARSGGTVQLANVARVVRDTGPSQIDHEARHCDGIRRAGRPGSTPAWAGNESLPCFACSFTVIR